ncbi:MAG: S9 family peptidase, partial [Erythrobacter sp.]|nr:S9 family peptidase [Erythrobacter sp.]
MVARWALAAALAFAPTAIAAQDTDADDPYIWLEEIQGERALAKVDQWNADTEAVLTDQPEYPLAKAWAKQILDDTRQIALPDAIQGDMVTNLWRDADNPRGLWRIASLESYMAGAPEWRVLIDVDKLGED